MECCVDVSTETVVNLKMFFSLQCKTYPFVKLFQKKEHMHRNLKEVFTLRLSSAKKLVFIIPPFLSIFYHFATICHKTSVNSTNVQVANLKPLFCTMATLVAGFTP